MMISNKTNIEICDALGLKNVIDLTISLRLKEVTTVEVKYYPDADELKAMIPVLQKYQLIPVEPEEDGEATD